LNSEQKSLTDGLGNSLDKFRADRKPKETKTKREGQKERNEKKKLEKGDDNAPKSSENVENEVDKSISKPETTSKSDKKSEKSGKPAKPAKKVKGENIHKPEPLQPLKISTFVPPEQVESPSTDDSFFIDENPSKPKKPKQVREERRARTKDKIQEQRLTRDVAMISNSKFSQDKKRAYHEKQDLYNKQKEKNDFVNKSNVREEFGTSQSQRREPQLSALEQNMHPSWQAKILQKRKLEEMAGTTNKKMTFDSDSDNDEKKVEKVVKKREFREKPVFKPKGQPQRANLAPELSAQEQSMHPSWQAKILAKRKLEEMVLVKNKKMVFSDSD